MTNYFMFWWVGPNGPRGVSYSGISSSCSIYPVYKTSSVTWLTVRPVRSDMATRVRLMSGWMVLRGRG